MKTLSNKFSPLEKFSFVEMTKDVNETSTTESSMKRHKTFSAADLWNIQRQIRLRTHRRFL